MEKKRKGSKSASLQRLGFAFVMQNFIAADLAHRWLSVAVSSGS
jgi:hypothetical protein